MTTQPELFKQKAPRITQGDVDVMINYLRGQDWLTARDLMPLGDERFLRAVASASEGQIISSNSGYKLTIEATQEEREHSIKRLRHQAAEMSKRAQQIETVGLKTN